MALLIIVISSRHLIIILLFFYLLLHYLLLLLPPLRHKPDMPLRWESAVTCARQSSSLAYPRVVESPGTIDRDLNPNRPLRKPD